MKRLIIIALIIWIGIELGKVGFDLLQRHIEHEVQDFQEQVHARGENH